MIFGRPRVTRVPAGNIGAKAAYSVNCKAILGNVCVFPDGKSRRVGFRPLIRDGLATKIGTRQKLRAADTWRVRVTNSVVRPRTLRGRGQVTGLQRSNRRGKEILNNGGASGPTKRSAEDGVTQKDCKIQKASLTGTDGVRPRPLVREQQR